MIEHECPECGEPMRSPDELAGELDECPACGQYVVVPIDPVDDYLPEIHHPELESLLAEDQTGPGFSQESSRTAKAILVIMGIITPIIWLGGIALHLWTTYLFYDNWGTFCAIMALLIPVLAELVALFACFWWGLWFYVLAVAAYLASWGFVTCVVVAKGTGKPAPVLAVLVVLVLIIALPVSFTYFAYSYAVNPKPITSALRERLEDDATTVIFILLNQLSDEALDAAKVAEAKSRLHRRTRNYGPAAMDHLCAIVDGFLRLNHSIQCDFVNYVAQARKDSHFNFSVSEKTRRLRSALPVRLLDRLGLTDEDFNFAHFNISDSFGLLAGDLPQNWRQRVADSFAKQRRLYGATYEQLLGRPMPSFPTPIIAPTPREEPAEAEF